MRFRAWRHLGLAFRSQTSCLLTTGRLHSLTATSCRLFAAPAARSLRFKSQSFQTENSFKIKKAPVVKQMLSLMWAIQDLTSGPLPADCSHLVATSRASSPSFSKVKIHLKLKKHPFTNRCFFLMWAIQDLNLGPKDYESSALTD